MTRRLHVTVPTDEGATRPERSAMSIVARLRSLGVRVRLRDGGIQHHPSALDAAALALLVENKQAIVAELSAPYACPDCEQRTWWRSVHYALPICRACFPPLRAEDEAPPGSPIEWSPYRIGGVAEVPLDEVNPWAPDPSGDPTTRAEIDGIREERSA